MKKIIVLCISLLLLLVLVGCSGGSSSGGGTTSVKYPISGTVLYTGRGSSQINLPAPYNAQKEWKTVQVEDGQTITISGTTQFMGDLEPNLTYEFGVNVAPGSPVKFIKQGTTVATTSFSTGTLNHEGSEVNNFTSVSATVQGTGLIEYGGWLDITTTKADLTFKFNVNYKLTN